MIQPYVLNNGIKIPSFGLGTFKLEAGQSFYETVMAALKIGYRHIDTAQAYGNERDIGSAIRDSGIPRSDIYVTTKLKFHHDGDEAKIRASLDESLEMLNIGYIDLMLIHWPNPDDEINVKIWKILEKYYEKKLFKSIGLSNFLKHHIETLLKHTTILPQVNQVECHPLLTQISLEKYLKSVNIQMISYGPFARGNVFNAPVHDTLLDIAKKYGATVTQVIIAWGLSRGIIMIPKSAHKERLIENYKGQEVVLSLADIARITKLNQGRRLYSDPDNNINYL